MQSGRELRASAPRNTVSDNGPIRLLTAFGLRRWGGPGGAPEIASEGGIRRSRVREEVEGTSEAYDALDVRVRPSLRVENPPVIFRYLFGTRTQEGLLA